MVHFDKYRDKMWEERRNLPDQVVFSIVWFRYEVVCEDVGLLSLQWTIL